MINSNFHRAVLASRQFILTVSLLLPTAWGWVHQVYRPTKTMGVISSRSIFRTTTTTTKTTSLSMGILDSLSGFLNNRQGDFIKLEESDGEYGPGPAVVLYNVPQGIDNLEFLDMLSDGAPTASRKGIALARVNDNVETDKEILSLSLQDALESIVKRSNNNNNGDEATSSLVTDAGILSKTPVLLFSGFANREMMDAYNIMGNEIYQETGGQSTAACAKAVPNAMQKTLQQVLEEIAGDHQDAIKDDIMNDEAA